MSTARRRGFTPGATSAWLAAVVIAVVVAVAAAAPATAAPWSAPVRVPDPGAGTPDSTDPGQLSFSRDGRAIMLLGYVAFPSMKPFEWTSVLGANGEFDAPQPAPGLTSVQLRAYGDGRVVLAGTDASPLDPMKPPVTPTSRGLVVLGSIGRAIDATQQLGATVRGSQVLVLDTSAAGAMAAALVSWTQGASPRERLELFVRSPEGRFRRAAVLADRRARARHELGAPSVAVDDAGDALVAWRQDGAVVARMRTAAGRLGAMQRLDRSSGSPAPVAELGNGRQALVGWSEGWMSQGRRRVARMSVASAPRGGRFRRAVVVDTVPRLHEDDLSPRLTVAQTGEDRGLVAWTGAAGKRYVTYAARVAHGRVLRARMLSPRDVDAQVGSIVTGAGGRLAVAWDVRPVFGETGPTALAVSVSADGGRTFAGAETIAAERGPFPVAVGSSTLAMDPLSGRLHAVWGQGFLGRSKFHAVREPIAG